MGIYPGLSVVLSLVTCRVSRSLQLSLMMTLLLLMAVFCHLGSITYQMQRSVKFLNLWELACIHFTGVSTRELLSKKLLAQGSWSFLSILNVMGVVIHALPPRDVYFEGSKRHGRDYIIVDQCKRPVVLTLWDDYKVIEGHVINESMASIPIIIAMRLRVTKHNYLSLSTQPSSVIIVAPNVLEARHLDDWSNANISKLVRMVFDDMAYLDPCILLPPVRDATFTPIYNVISQATSDQGTFWIKGRVEIAWPLAHFWHMACPHCYEPYEFSSTLGIICLSCGQGMHEFPRAWVRLTVFDNTGYVNVIALGPEAENLIGLSVANMYRVSDHQTFEISKRVSH
ncbi:replication protein A 70 kDa DNA-binding subunit B-like isoform X2 [Coffea arabica]|uniref:Replication protein A 70 kDa DNA-binding subunit B-like isoform X2 n=1 Tax=Coffea arabica TaxID=13443 RepID=A0ABM4VPJ3_COFAR